MKSLIRELKISIFSPYFLLSIIMMVLLCIVSPMPNSYNIGDPSIIQCILNKDIIWLKSSIANSSYEVFKCYDNFEWFPIIMPIISGFAPIYYINSENESKLSRFVLIRSNKNEYIICKMVSSGLTGGFTVILGILLYGIIVYLNFPNLNQYYTINLDLALEDIKMYSIFPNQLEFKYRISFLCIKLLFTFSTAFLTAIIIYLFLIIIKNKFLTITLPVIINYLLLNIIAKLTIIHIDNEKVYYWLYFFCPCWHYNMYYAFPALYKSSYLWYIPIFFCYIAIIFICIKNILDRRTDFCE